MLNTTSIDGNDAVDRARLRGRLGSGARYDSPAAPQVELSWARLGTAYFARKLNELSDDDLDGLTLIPGLSRRHVIAHVGYQARKLSSLVEAARKGLEHQAFIEPGQSNEDISFGATLPAHALRYLFAHSEVHLNVEWRDLHTDGWRATVIGIDGRPVPIRETPCLRAREIWEMAVVLNNGGRRSDVPSELRNQTTSQYRTFGRRMAGANS